MTARTAMAGWLLAGATALGAVAVESSYDPSPEPPPAAAKDRSVDERADLPDLQIEPPQKEVLDDILARPLFFASRRPSSQVNVPSILVGTVVTDKSRTALLSHPTEGLVVVRQGQEFGGWQIGEIKEGEVSLLQDRRVERLTLRKETPVGRIVAPKPGDEEAEADAEGDGDGNGEGEEKNGDGDRAEPPEAPKSDEQ